MASIAFSDIPKTRNKKHPVLRRMFFVATISLLPQPLHRIPEFLLTVVGVASSRIQTAVTEKLRHFEGSDAAHAESNP